MRSRGAALLNGARQERVAAEEREQTAWQETKGKVEEEEKTQDDGETKRGSGKSRLSIVKSKHRPPNPNPPRTNRSSNLSPHPPHHHP